MKISIAMTTYNGARYLRDQLHSIREQILLPDELVVVDDGSTDATPTILADFQAEAPFQVTILRNPSTLGVTRNFEKAISSCSGEIIFLSDQDDYWHPEKLDVASAIFGTDPSVQVVINEQVVTDEALRPIGKNTFQSIQRLGRGRIMFFTGCCTAMRREWAAFTLPLPDGVTHDGWINQLAEYLGVRRIVTTPLQSYRRHGANVSASATSSTSRGPIEVTAFRTHGLKDTRAGWSARIEGNRLMLNHLQTRKSEAITLTSSSAVDRAIAEISGTICAAEQRISICSLPRWRRLPSIVGFGLKGGYRHFSGWKSAVKDAMRAH